MRLKKALSAILCFCMVAATGSAFAETPQFKVLGNNETVSYGYTQPEAANILFINTLPSDVTITDIATDDTDENFIADLESDITVPAGERTSFAVALKTGKAPGTYTANYTFTDSESHIYTAAASVTVTESFDLSSEDVTEIEWDYESPVSAVITMENHTTDDVVLVNAESSNPNFVLTDLSEENLTVSSTESAEYEVKLPLGKDAGTYTSTITFTTSESDTYTQDISVKIVSKKLTVPAVIGTPYVYNGQVQALNLDDNFIEKYMMVLDNARYATNANHYAPVITLKDKANTVWNIAGSTTTTNQTLSWDIEKYKLTKPTAKAVAYTYTGDVQEFQFDNFTESVFGSEVFTVTGGEKTDAGTSSVTVSINDKQNYCWTDGSNADLVFTWNMSRAKVSEPVATRTSYDYDETEHKIEFEDGTVDTNLMTVKNNSRTEIGSQTVTISLKDKVNYEWQSGTDTDITLTLSIGVPIYSLPTITGSYVYNGQTQHPEFTGFDAEKMTVTDNSAKNAGSYSVKIALKDKDHAKWADTGTNEDRVLTWTIAKASVTVAAKNKTAKAGDPVPVLNADDYTITGIIRSDSLGFIPSISYTAEPDMSVPGTAFITVSGPDVSSDNNYSVTYINATLTIGESQIADKLTNVDISFDLPLAAMNDMEDAIDNLKISTSYASVSFENGAGGLIDVFDQETDADITAEVSASGLSENAKVYLKMLLTPNSGKVIDKDTTKIRVNGKLLSVADTKKLSDGEAVEIPFTVSAYRIHFDKGLGTGQMGTQYASSTTEYTFPESKFTAPAGKQFDKWQIKNDTASYKAGEKLVLTDSINLVAIYKDKSSSSGGSSGGGGIIIGGGGSGSSSGGAQEVTSGGEVQEPAITANNDTVIALSKDGTAATFTPSGDYIIVDVILNGTSLGPVESLTGLKTGDIVEVITQNKAEVQKELKTFNLIARSKNTTAPNGKKAIKIVWHDANDKAFDFDGVEIQRSTERYSGYKKVFVSTKGNYYNTSIKSGVKYYYRIRGYVIFNGEKIYTPWSLKAIRTAE